MSLPCHVMSEKALESHSFSFYKQSSSFFSSSNLSSHSLLFHFENLLLPLHCTIVRYSTFLPSTTSCCILLEPRSPLPACSLSHCNLLLLSHLLDFRVCLLSPYVYVFSFVNHDEGTTWDSSFCFFFFLCLTCLFCLCRSE